MSRIFFYFTEDIYCVWSRNVKNIYQPKFTIACYDNKHGEESMFEWPQNH